MRVTLPSQLYDYTSGVADVEASGTTLAEVLADLDRRFPGLRFRVIDEQDRVRRHMVIFVDGARQDDLHARFPEGASVYVVGALSGG